MSTGTPSPVIALIQRRRHRVPNRAHSCFEHLLRESLEMPATPSDGDPHQRARNRERSQADRDLRS
jgi:hypothetical protein